VLYGLGVPHLIASATSFSTSVVLNYILSRRYVFEAQENVSVLKEFTLYVLLNVVALGLNTLILYVCADLAGMSPFLGKIIATAVVLIYNFISRKALLERLRCPPHPHVGGGILRIHVGGFNQSSQR